VIDWLERMESAFEGLGPLGYLLFAIAYVLWALVLLPESIFTILAGALLGTRVVAGIELDMRPDA